MWQRSLPEKYLKVGNRICFVRVKCLWHWHQDEATGCGPQDDADTPGYVDTQQVPRFNGMALKERLRGVFK
jgi:hypothetical protein